MHDLLASEYDMGNVAVTKMRHPAGKSDIEEHENAESADVWRIVSDEKVMRLDGRQAWINNDSSLDFC